MDRIFAIIFMASGVSVSCVMLITLATQTLWGYTPGSLVMFLLVLLIFGSVTNLLRKIK